VEHTVFAVLGIALDHLVAALEAREGHFVDRVLLVGGLGSREQGSIGGKREVNTREAKEGMRKLAKVSEKIE
jgi:hypothetical protein